MLLTGQGMVEAGFGEIAGWAEFVAIIANQPASKMRVWRFAIREDILFSILQGPEMDFREWKRCVSTQKTH